MAPILPSFPSYGAALLNCTTTCLENMKQKAQVVYTRCVQRAAAASKHPVVQITAISLITVGSTAYLVYQVGPLTTFLSDARSPWSFP